MPLINYVRLYGSEVAQVLDTGERLLDMGPYREPLIGDEGRLLRTPDELGPKLRRLIEERGPLPERSKRSDRFIEGFDPLMGGLQVNPRHIDRLMGGISGEGGPRSVAGRLWRAPRSHTGSTYYAVTDRRLLLVAASKPGATDYRVIFETPRDSVTSAARQGKLLFQRGRVEVRFADGSMKAWTPGMVSAARARSLVAALAGPSIGASGY
jgi:hypothetical protein